jgi:hypothetical protein
MVRKVTVIIDAVVELLIFQRHTSQSFAIVIIQS